MKYILTFKSPLMYLVIEVGWQFPVVRFDFLNSTTQYSCIISKNLMSHTNADILGVFLRRASSNI